MSNHFAETNRMSYYMSKHISRKSCEIYFHNFFWDINWSITLQLLCHPPMIYANYSHSSFLSLTKMLKNIPICIWFSAKSPFLDMNHRYSIPMSNPNKWDAKDKTGDRKGIQSQLNKAWAKRHSPWISRSSSE